MACLNFSTSLLITLTRLLRKGMFGEQIIKRSLVEFDRRIEKWKGNRD